MLWAGKYLKDATEGYISLLAQQEWATSDR